MERDIAFMWSLLSAAATLFLLAAMPSLALTAVVTVWLGAFCGLAWVSGYTLLQENVEDEFRGRTFASLTALSRLGLFCASPSSLSCRHAMTPIPSQPARSSTLSGTRLALWAAGALARHRRLQHAAPPRAASPLPSPAPRARAEAEAAAGHRVCSSPSRASKGRARAPRSGSPRSTSAREGHDVLVTREPGGTELGEKIREVLLDPKTGSSMPAARPCSSPPRVPRRSRP